MNNGAVITSYGIISPLGNDPDTFYKNLLSGKILPTINNRINTNHLPQNKAFFLPGSLTKKNTENIDKLLLAELIPEDLIINPIETYIINATTMAAGIHGQNQIMHLRDNQHISTWEEALNCVSSSTAEYIAEKKGISNYCTLSDACSSGTSAIGLAKRLLESDKYKQILVTTTNILHEIPFYGFSSLRLMAKDLCRPFDKNRSGLLLGESIAYILIEQEKFAKQRDADISCTISGYGASSDATHITRPDLNGTQASKAIKKALYDANLSAKDIDYINAHGTGTKANDIAETNAIKSVFMSSTTPVSSIKAVTGHTLGSAGIIEAIAIIETIKNKIIPPTHNYQEPDPKCDLNYLPNIAIEKKCTRVMSNSFGFGGNNAVIIMEEYK